MTTCTMLRLLVLHGVHDTVEGVLGVHPDGHGHPHAGGLHARQKLVTVEVLDFTEDILNVP